MPVAPKPMNAHDLAAIAPAAPALGGGEPFAAFLEPGAAMPIAGGEPIPPIEVEDTLLPAETADLLLPLIEQQRAALATPAAAVAPVTPAIAVATETIPASANGSALSPPATGAAVQARAAAGGEARAKLARGKTQPPELPAAEPAAGAPTPTILGRAATASANAPVTSAAPGATGGRDDVRPARTATNVQVSTPDATPAAQGPDARTAAVAAASHAVPVTIAEIKDIKPLPDLGQTRPEPSLQPVPVAPVQGVAQPAPSKPADKASPKVAEKISSKLAEKASPKVAEKFVASLTAPKAALSQASTAQPLLVQGSVEAAAEPIHAPPTAPVAAERPASVVAGAPPADSAAPASAPAAPIISAAPAPVPLATAAATVAQALAAQVLTIAADGAWIDALARDISRMASGSGDLRFRLTPETLGELRVEISQSERGAVIRMSVSSEAAQAAIADAQPRLLAEARAQGVRIADAQVDLASSHQNRGDAQRHQNAQPDQPLRALRHPHSQTRPAADAAPGRTDRYA